jgi:uncharacterized RDD family membrane protein YckC
MEYTGSQTCPVCGGEKVPGSTCTSCGKHPGTGRPSSIMSEPWSPAPATSPATDTRSAAPFPQGPTSTPGVRVPSPPGGLDGTAAAGLAGFWIRVCAYVLDSIILSVIVWLLLTVAIAGYSLGASGSFSADYVASSRASWPSMAGMVVYFTLFLARGGQTPAKKLFGLRVVRTDGGPLTNGQALIRTIGYYVNMLTFGIGFLWVAVDRRKQGLHDKIAGTLELRVRPA